MQFMTLLRTDVRANEYLFAMFFNLEKVTKGYF